MFTAETFVFWYCFVVLSVVIGLMFLLNWLLDRRDMRSGIPLNEEKSKGEHHVR